MGKFLDKIKQATTLGAEKIDNMRDIPVNNTISSGKLSNKHNKHISNVTGGFEDEDNGEELTEEGLNGEYNDFDDVGIQPAQKLESFHHFILENQYKDLERSIRGLKDVWDKETQTWKTKRKDIHCFTDEEAEDILRTAQSHLATDIKLGWIRKDAFGDYMDAVYKELAFLFESIAEYRYGRYGNFNKQYDMKLQNQKIFLELWTRVQANYSRSIEGQENKEIGRAHV